MWIIIKACGTATTYVPDCSLLGLTASAKDTRAPSRNEPDLFSRARVSCHGGWMPDVLVVTSAVRMLHRGHRGATNLRPTIPLHAVFVKAVSRLEHWLVHATTPSDDADNRTASRWDGLPGSRRQAESGVRSEDQTVFTLTAASDDASHGRPC